MKKLVIGILCVSAVLTSVGCKKKGDFTTDKAVYIQGEVITVTNTTEKGAENYTWRFGGVEVVGENPVYTIPKSTPVGTFEISILPHNFENTSDSWKRTTMSVMVEEAEEAKMIFYLPSPRTGSPNETFSVTIDSETKYGSVGNSYSCTSTNPNAATFKDMPSGEYDYEISGSSSSGTYYLYGTVELENGFSCEPINVTNL
ncbi:MAG: hypothetical protein AB8B56_01890 [Crocinitomicaceae bacterium]